MIKFITIEGGEGSGKTSLIKLLVNDFKEMNIDTLTSREPGGSKIAEEIRSVILNVENTNMDYMTEALLYAASRKQHLEEIIKPAIENGKVVICDRYIDSSLAYQGYARGLGVDFVEKINDYAVKNFMPDYTVFLSLPPEQAFLRKGGVDKTDRLELSGIEFHNKVYGGYLDLAKKHPERFLVIDASGSKEETHAKVISALKEKGIIW